MSFELLKKHYKLDIPAHSSRKLWDHLSGVYEILKSWDECEDVCKAGLFHSVYGTEVYQHQSIPLSERARLAESIGSRAEQLSYYFSAFERQSIWKNMARRDSDYTAYDRFEKKEISLSREDLQDYFSIFLANLIEQRPYLTRAKNTYVSEMLAAQTLFKPQIWKQFLIAYQLN